MAKTIVKTREELVNYAQKRKIVTENKSLEQIAQELIDKLMSHYDEYTAYIENYRQQVEAERRNDEILAEVTSVKQLVLQVNNMQYCVYVGDPTYYYQESIEYAGTKDECQAYIGENENKTPYDNSTTCSYRIGKTPTTMSIKDIVKLKEEKEMVVTTTNVTVNNATKEVSMVQLTKEQVNEMGTMTMRRRIIDLGYDTIEVKSTVEGKNTTEKYRNFLLSLIDEADVQRDAEQQIENHEIMHGEVQENTEVIAPATVVVPAAPVAQPAVVTNNEAKAKTDKLFALIKEKAADNDKKGFGYTISSFMLQAVILEAGTGLKKLKGHTVTAEEEKLTWNIYKWLKEKGFIKPVVYSVQEDDKVRIFMPEYPGKTENTTVKMIPYNKSNGYTAKKATSFLVTIPGAGAGK